MNTAQRGLAHEYGRWAVSQQGHSSKLEGNDEKLCEATLSWRDYQLWTVLLAAHRSYLHEQQWYVVAIGTSSRGQKAAKRAMQRDEARWAEVERVQQRFKEAQNVPGPQGHDVLDVVMMLTDDDLAVLDDVLATFVQRHQQLFPVPDEREVGEQLAAPLRMWLVQQRQQRPVVSATLSIVSTSDNADNETAREA